MELIRQEVKDIRLSIRRICSLAMDRENCIRFDIGEPDFDTPQYIKDGAIAALKEKRGYSPYRGYPELREAIAGYEAWKGVGYTADNVTVTNGGMHALNILFVTCLNPGEEVILPRPFWSAYGLPIIISHGKLKSIPFKPGLEEVDNAITSKTKFIVVNSPSNPTGEVYSEDFLKEIACFARDHDLYILSDEVYDQMILEPTAVHYSIVNFAPERTFLLNSCSKTFAMTGWRLGWLCGPKEAMVEVAKGNRGTIACPNSVAQMGALTALNGFNTIGREEVDKMVEAYKERAKVMRERAVKIGWKMPFIPRGALYIFPECCDDSWKFSMELIEKIGVSSVPGKAFGAEGHIRLCFGSVSTDKIHEAFDRIENM